MPTGNQQDEENPEENERPPDRAQVHFPFAVSRSRPDDGWDGCPYRKSSPGILVMETAKDWTAKNVSSALYPARYRRILAQ